MTNDPAVEAGNQVVEGPGSQRPSPSRGYFEERTQGTQYHSGRYHHLDFSIFPDKGVVRTRESSGSSSISRGS